MERKDYLVEKLSKEENIYLKKVVMTAKNKYIEKNYNYINNTIVGVDEENITFSDDSVLDMVLNDSSKNIKSAIEFEELLLNPNLKKIVKALTFNEKRVLFYLHKQNKSINEISKIMNLHRVTVQRIRNRAYKIIAENLIKGEV